MDTPNIVVLVLDAVRSDRTSAYGHEWSTTPNLEALAEEGVTYENAFANSNWTGTSHATLFTGRLPSDSGVYGGNQKLPKNVTTLPEELSKVGYRTFAMSAGAHIRAERGYNRGVDHYKETYQIAPNRDFVAGLLSDPALRRQTVQSVVRGPDKKSLYKFESMKQWIAEVDSPFFGFVNAKTAHHPYNPPRPHKSKYCPGLQRPRYQFLEELLGDEQGERQSLPGMDWERLQKLSYEYPVLSGEINPSEEEWDVVRSWYDGSIHYLDSLVGQFVDWLKHQDHLDETYLIITADHGEYFGEHGFEKHYYGLYDPVLRIPLIIREPGGGDGRKIDSIVSLADLYPTIIELATGDASDHPHAQSLVPFDEGPDHNYVFAELGAVDPAGIVRHHPDFDDTGYGVPTQVVRNDRYKLIERADDTIELYDWVEDPSEQDDLSESNPEVTQRLRSIIDEELGQLSEETLSEEIKDDRLRDHLQDLGYM